MATSERPFPNPGAPPGEHSIDWRVGKRRAYPGDVALAPWQRPRIELRGKLRRPSRNAAGELVYAFPGEPVEFGRLAGRLPSNEEVVVIDANLHEFFPERFVGFGRWGLIGLDIFGVPSRATNVTGRRRQPGPCTATEPTALRGPVKNPVSETRTRCPSVRRTVPWNENDLSVPTATRPRGTPQRHFTGSVKLPIARPCGPMRKPLLAPIT